MLLCYLQLPVEKVLKMGSKCSVSVCQGGRIKLARFGNVANGPQNAQKRVRQSSSPHLPKGSKYSP